MITKITKDTNLDNVKGDINFFEYFMSLYRNEYVDFSKEEIYDLINKAQRGDKEAFDQVLLCNLPLAIKFAYAFSYADDLEDLVQQAVLGLMEAIKHFDTSTGYAFSTYAWHWVRQSITRYIDSCGSCLKKPVHINDKLRKYKKIMEEFNNYDPYSEKYVFEDKFQFVLKHNAVKDRSEFIAMEDMVKNEYVFSLDFVISDDIDHIGLSSDLLDTLADDSFNLEEDFLKNEEIDTILHIIRTNLTEMQADVLKMRCGLLPYPKPMTLEEIGQVKGVTRERIRQIQKKAIEIIKRYYKE